MTTPTLRARFTIVPDGDGFAVYDAEARRCVSEVCDDPFTAGDLRDALIRAAARERVTVRARDLTTAGVLAALERVHEAARWDYLTDPRGNR